jgi:hypothetical protein
MASLGCSSSGHQPVANAPPARTPWLTFYAASVLDRSALGREVWTLEPSLSPTSVATLKNDAWGLVATGVLGPGGLILTSANGARYHCRSDVVHVHVRNAIPTLDCDWKEAWPDSPTQVRVWVCSLYAGPGEFELGTYAAGPVVFADPPIELVNINVCGGTDRCDTYGGYRFANPSHVPDRVFIRACPSR